MQAMLRQNTTINLTDLSIYDLPSSVESMLAVYGVILIFVLIVGLVSNCAIIMSILVSKKLRNESLNLMILSICSADLVILMFDRPILIYSAITPSLLFSTSACLAETFFESFGFSVQMINMGILGFERFLSISRPLEVTDKRQRILHFILYSWLVGVLCGVGALVNSEKSSNYRLCRRELLSSTGYFDYMAIPLGAVTTVFIAIMYALIMHLVRVHTARMKNKKTPQKAVVTDMISADEPRSRAASLIPTPNLSPFFAAASYARRVSPAVLPSVHDLGLPQPTAVEVYDYEGNKAIEVVDVHNNAGAVCKFTPKNRETARRKMELKTAQKSMAVVASFLLCWLPLPICHRAVSEADAISWWHFLPLLTLTLTAAVNPVVYAFVNKQIRLSGRNFLWELKERLIVKRKSSS